MFDIKKAIKIAQYSDIIYKEYGGDMEDALAELNIHEYKYVARKDTQALIVVDKTKKELYIIFRGTSSLHDWITNANCKKIDTIHGGVHKGAYEAYEAVSGDIEKLIVEIIANHPDWKIWTGGHSLGAISILCAYNIWQHISKNIAGVYIFGGMRIFDRKGSNEYNNSLGDKTYNVVYLSDHVPNFPYGYCRVGQRVYINAKGNIDVTEKEWKKEYFIRVFDTLRNAISFNAFRKPHGIENYLEKLMQGKNICVEK
ncbi:lipase family protein [Patescibacteria group bacterium]|nr:lipase family protein [Patescibacteria group bacterium]MBU0879867.1 lipase family protein [Patescibacteria group bacterium]MBU1992013.1 lipase family protein [Patescibacteria group bacterium]MBU2251804.1 lipase family protein [Candidatus Omnitrophota bacterium]MBU2474290.1 lipase family protein [Candidatus Omnitrophota bacterium]